ncbi:MAG: molybdopterin-dependent oxidoreductase [Gemmatimonadales bacterium]
MTLGRRQFLWTMGATTAAVALQDQLGIEWSSERVTEEGWAPGVEERLVSSCLICPGRCGITGRVVDGRLIRVTGNPLHPMNRGGVCPRGVAGVQMLYHPERVTSPLLRVGSRGGGEWRNISPQGAVKLIAQRLATLRSEARPEGLALLAGYCAGTTEDLWRQFLRAFGSPNYVSDSYADGVEAVMELMHGMRRQPSYDFERADLVLSFGAHLFDAWWSPLQTHAALRPAANERRRPRFVQVDTRLSRSAASSSEWIATRPGTQGTLALGIAYVMLREESYDSTFVREHVSGFEDYTDARGSVHEGYRSVVLRNYRPEEVSTVTGVPVERILSLAKEFADADAAVAVCGPDVTHSQNGLLSGLAVHSLNVLKGSINRRGGVLFPDDPPLSPLIAIEQDDVARNGLARQTVTGAPTPFGDASAGDRLAEAIAAGSTSPLDVLLLYYANPLASSVHPETWRAALARIPFVVSFSPFLDETASHADLVFPDLLPYERWQDAPTPPSFPYPVWGITRPLVEPRPGATHTGEVILALARELGGAVARSLPYEDFATLLKERARGLFEARRGIPLDDEFEREHYRQMEERGWWLPAHDDFEEFWQDLVSRGGWADLYYDDTDPARLSQGPSGRIQLLPDRLRQALGRPAEDGYLSLRTQDVAVPESFPLRLIPYRLSTLASGTLPLERWMAERPSTTPDVHWVPWVEVHPATAHDLGLGDRTMVRVVSARGGYSARVRLYPGVPPDAVGAPYGVRHPDGGLANPLQLLDPTTDTLTGIQSWSSTFVRLERE